MKRNSSVKEFDALVKYAADRSFGVLVPSKNGVNIDDSINSALFIKLYLKNTKSTFTLISMCGFNPEKLKDVRLLVESQIPSETLIGNLLQYLLGQSSVNDTQVYKTLLEHKETALVFLVNELIRPLHLQQILNLIKRYIYYIFSLSVNEYTARHSDKSEINPKTIKYAQYEKIRKASTDKKTPSPDKNNLRNPLKRNIDKNVKEGEAEVNPVKRLKKEVNRVIYKASSSKKLDRTLPIKEKKATPHTDVIKENELLREQNKEFQIKIRKLEKCLSGNTSAKLLFDTQKRLSEMELELKSSQLKVKENGQLIKQLLATIDYMNQSADIKSAIKKTKLGEKEEHKFLFNKYELVNNHTQLGQIRVMVFDTFKTLQISVAKDNPKILGMVSFLSSKLEELFEIIHNIEKKGLEYLSLIIDNAKCTYCIHVLPVSYTHLTLPTTPYV
eukprot:TRINITY_DN6010_c0_g1_i9.p1 TRINITY_DN6010_c0_g1~~TRINITY_DN6010_c0_g1_i9.p1  ORF type:complete len:444 (+),score=80.63 TRINITY_DN6010_c0_g1_i9:789-2120(+)